MTSMWLNSSGCDSNKVDYAVSGKYAKNIAKCFVLIMFSASPVMAADAVGAVADDGTALSDASKALTRAICVAAGSVCTKAVEEQARSNPKLVVAFGCVALMTWCAAKASPI